MHESRNEHHLIIKSTSVQGNMALIMGLLWEYLISEISPLKIIMPTAPELPDYVRVRAALCCLCYTANIMKIPVLRVWRAAANKS